MGRSMVLTSSPGNEAELQLYRVMQRASLLAYYDTLLEMGGDDVRQLCEAGEDEFLEIMALVGMAAKPLHVRRLQKALREWLTNPAMFLTPLIPPDAFSPAPIVPPAPPSPSQSSPGPPARCPQSPSPNSTQMFLGSSGCSEAGGPRSPGTSPGPGSPLQLTPVLAPSQVYRLSDAARALIRSLPHLEPKANPAKKKASKDLEAVLAMSEDDPQRMDQIRKYSAIYGRFDCKRKPEKPLTLHEVSVNEAAAQICRLAPALLTRRDELFPLARQVVRDSGYHYSKGHSKSYSVSYGQGSGRSSLGYSNGEHSAKRQRLDPADLTDEALWIRRQERLEQIADEMRAVECLVSGPPTTTDLQALQLQHARLLAEQAELARQQHAHQPAANLHGSGNGRVSSSFDTDDTDSQLSYSNASSPCQEIGDSRDSLTREADAADSASAGVKLKQGESDEDARLSMDGAKPNPDDADDSYYSENKEKVIASRGDNIIAVANPALSMSAAVLKKEALSPRLSSPP